jgi:hypothetical protein
MEHRLTISGIAMHASSRLTISGTVARVKASDQEHVLTLTHQDQKGKTYTLDIECPPPIALNNFQPGQQVTVTLAGLRATAVQRPTPPQGAG